ncbi:MAG TPA: GAF domain-containing SpoIIE family protein phosphatase [Actinocrinis sp.]|nr:GAF domain-containing SpoIIE family protein phosphatase [Actinocrinis sp.]
MSEPEVPRPGAGGIAPEVLAPRRLAAVYASGLLDAGPEDGFDDLARLAAAVAGGQRAFITVIDERRSYWLSAVGPGLGGDGPRCLDLPDSPCQLLIATGKPLIIDDTAADPRVSGLAGVSSLAIGAWAGYPIHSPDGEILGGLCVLNDHPHRWTEEQIQGLGILARSVTTEIGLRQSLRAATRQVRVLQESLLPETLPEIPGLDASAAYLPSGGAEVSGDFYDLFALRNDTWGVVLGDVCGKGVRAAKITALARYTLRAEATRHQSPAVVLGRLNTALITQQVKHRRFLTAVYATFRMTPSGGLAGRISAGGHPLPLVRRADGRVQEVGRLGMLLGLATEVDLSDVRFRLEPGDTLLLFSDGVTEARRAHGPAELRPVYGEERLHEVLASCAELSAAQTLDRICLSVREHTDGQMSDDTALLAVHVPAS